MKPCLVDDIVKKKSHMTAISRSLIASSTGQRLPYYQTPLLLYELQHTPLRTNIPPV